MRTPALLLVLLAAAATVATAATTYRWVDEQGVTHYSDQPHPGADKIQLAQPQTYSAPQASAQPGGSRAAQPGAGPADRSFQYSRCAIVQPADDEVLLEQAVTVRGELSPPVRPGDHVYLVFDTATMEAPSPGQLEFHIEPVERGTHSVSLQVRDGSGRAVCQSQPVSFHRREPSALAPQNPNNPANHKH